MSLFALLPSAGGAIGSPGVEALFFARFGVEFLPYMYLALGLLTMVSTLSLTAVLKEVPKSRLYRALPLTLGVLLVAARLVVGLDLPAFYPVLWLGMYLFWTLQALFLWGVAALLFDTRQAKRLFPLFGASSIFGNALGGLLTGALVGWLGAPNLLLIWALSLGLAFPLGWRLTHAYDPPEVHFHRPRPTLRETLVGGAGTVQRSPLLRWLSVATALLAVLLFALAFPFSEGVAAQFPDENAMAGFLGVFQGVTTATALLMSLGIANRLFARVGFVGALLVFPALYAVGFSLLAAAVSFSLLAVFRFAQQAWRMGIADTAYQATFNLVPPDRREPTRMFLDGVPKQAGVALSGILLITIQPILSPRPQFVASAGIALLAAFALWKARTAYRRALTDALVEGKVHVFDDEEAPFQDLRHDGHAIGALTEGLRSEEAAVRRTAVEILGQLQASSAREAMVRSLQDPDPEVRAASLRALAGAEEGKGIHTQMLKALADPSAEVRRAAVQALPASTLAEEGAVTRLEGLLGDPDPEVKALAAARLLRSDRHPQAAATLEQMAQSAEESLRRAALTGYQSWGGERAYAAAASQLKDPHPKVRRGALETLASIDPSQCLRSIRDALGDPDGSVRVAAAEVMASLGADAVPTALEALGHLELERGALLALEGLPLRGGERAILAFIQNKVAEAQHCAELREQLSPAGEGRERLRLLSRSLQHAARSHAFSAIQAFRLRVAQESATLALEGLRSDLPDQRANALELLDSLDEENLIRPVLKLWEPDPPPDLTKTHASQSDRRYRALHKLLGSQDDWLRACAAFAVTEGADGRLGAKLAELSESDPDPLVRETAAYVLVEEERMQSLITLPIMERVLFLRRVPLFADLPPEDLKRIASIAGEHLFKDGEAFVREGELGDEMYIIVSGKVRVVTGPEGQTELARRGPGEYVGEMSLLTHEPRMASLIAQGDVRALCIEQSKFERILLEKPEIGLYVMRSLIHRLQDSRASVERWSSETDERSGAATEPVEA
jgi:HEAT repeat protein